MDGCSFILCVLWPLLPWPKKRMIETTVIMFRGSCSYLDQPPLTLNERTSKIETFMSDSGFNRSLIWRLVPRRLGQELSFLEAWTGRQGKPPETTVLCLLHLLLTTGRSTRLTKKKSSSVYLHGSRSLMLHRWTGNLRVKVLPPGPFLTAIMIGGLSVRRVLR